MYIPPRQAYAEALKSVGIGRKLSLLLRVPASSRSAEA